MRCLAPRLVVRPPELDGRKAFDVHAVDVIRRGVDLGNPQWPCFGSQGLAMTSVQENKPTCSETHYGRYALQLLSLRVAAPSCTAQAQLMHRLALAFCSGRTTERRTRPRRPGQDFASYGAEASKKSRSGSLEGSFTTDSKVDPTKVKTSGRRISIVASESWQGRAGSPAPPPTASTS